MEENTIRRRNYDGRKFVEPPNRIKLNKSIFEMMLEFTAKIDVRILM
jgi:hypothetical protein